MLDFVKQDSETCTLVFSALKNVESYSHPKVIGLIAKQPGYCSELTF